MSSGKETATVVGVGAVACAACCAGPILAALSAVGIGSIAGTVVFGVGALVVGAILAIALVAGRRIGRRDELRQADHMCASDSSCCGPAPVVPVALTASRDRV